MCYNRNEVIRLSDYFEYGFHVEFGEDTETRSCNRPKRNAPIKKERKQFIDLSLVENFQYNAELDNGNVEVGESCAIIISDSGIILHDNDTGEAFPIDLPLTTFYERKSGKDKVVNYLPAGALTDPNKIILNYDRIIAIDTNTKEKTSVTAIAQCFTQKTPSGFDGIIIITCHKWDSTQFPKPEMQAWAAVMHKMILQKPEILTSDIRIAVIVDSELGLLQEYNTHQRSLAPNFYLPPNFTLIYASADSGSEFLANKLIQLCDKHATQTLNQ